MPRRTPAGTAGSRRPASGARCCRPGTAARSARAWTALLLPTTARTGCLGASLMEAWWWLVSPASGEAARSRGTPWAATASGGCRRASWGRTSPEAARTARLACRPRLGEAARGLLLASGCLTKETGTTGSPACSAAASGMTGCWSWTAASGTMEWLSPAVVMGWWIPGAASGTTGCWSSTEASGTTAWSSRVAMAWWIPGAASGTTGCWSWTAASGTTAWSSLVAMAWWIPGVASGMTGCWSSTVATGRTGWWIPDAARGMPACRSPWEASGTTEWSCLTAATGRTGWKACHHRAWWEWQECTPGTGIAPCCSRTGGRPRRRTAPPAAARARRGCSSTRRRRWPARSRGAR
ncbi:hypothetical protein VPH35_103548 [Triticum aestivum]